MPKWLPKSLTNQHFGVQGSIFSILGGFLRSLIFYEFSVGKKSAKTAPQATQGEPKARPRRPKEGQVAPKNHSCGGARGPKVLQRGKEFLRRLRGTMMPTSETYAKFQQTALLPTQHALGVPQGHGADLLIYWAQGSLGVSGFALHETPGTGRSPTGYRPPGIIFRLQTSTFELF